MPGDTVTDTPPVSPAEDAQWDAPPMLKADEILTYTVAGLVLAGVQAAGLEAVLAGRLAPMAGLAGHVGISVAMLVWALIPKRADKRLHATLAIGSSLLFIFGTLGSLLTLVVREYGVRRRLGGAAWHALLFPAQTLSHAERLHQDARRKLHTSGTDIDSEIVPLADIFARGHRDDRLRVLAYLARNFKPQYADALRAALHDPDPAIRAQAAGTTAGLDQQMADELRRLYDKTQAAPADWHARKALADHLDAYARSGLVSKTVAQDYRERALAIYRGLLTQAPANEHVRMCAVRLLLRMRRITDAVGMLDASADRVENLRLWLPWIAEAYYRSGRFADLHALAQRAKREIDLGDVPLGIKFAIETWADSGHASD